MKNFYLLLIIVCIGIAEASTTKNEFCPLDISVNITYPNQICIASDVTISPTISGTGNYLGGTFSAFPSSLQINPVTGAISIPESVPGTYVVVYTVPNDPITGEPGITVSTMVTIFPASIPTFNAVGTICYGSEAPTLSPVSIEGISGTWMPSVVSNTATTVYTFTPNPGECAVTTSIEIQVFSPYVPVITTADGLQTVYVDDSNTVVLPLELISEMPEGYTFQWSEGTTMIPSATNANYTVDTASLDGSTRFYRVWVNNIETGCHTVSSIFPVFQSNGTPPPSAPRMQTLAPGSTLADLSVSGTDIQWYISASNKNAMSLPLPLNTVLVDNATYYATQTIDGEESLERRPVTVNLTLGIGGNELVSLIYSPNPVKNSLIIKADNTIDTVSIINISGQVLKTSTYNQDQIVENLSDLSSGIYFIRVTSGDKMEVFKIIKE